MQCSPQNVSSNPMENSAPGWPFRTVLVWGRAAVLFNLCAYQSLDVDVDHLPEAPPAAEELCYSLLKGDLGGSSQHPQGD